VTEAVLRRREALPHEELSESRSQGRPCKSPGRSLRQLDHLTAYRRCFVRTAEAKLFTPMAYTGLRAVRALLNGAALVPGLAYLRFASLAGF